MSNEDVFLQDKIDAAMDLARYEIVSATVLFESEQYRDSITHSYYAMFTAAKAMLFTTGFDSKSHDNTLKEFGKVFIHNGDFNPEVYNGYYNAKRQRKQSSYDFSLSFSESVAEKRLHQAEDFITEAEKYLADFKSSKE